MELLGKRLILTSVSLNAAETLLLAFNGDRQFNVWSGYASAMTLDQVRTDMAETQNLPGGVVWQITDKTDTLVGVAETALFPPNTAWIALLIICHDFQGRGYGSEAATLLENHLFTYPEMTRIGLA